MRQIKRILSLATLGAFLWVAGIGQLHSHAGAQQNDRCTVCQAVNHAPALTQAITHTPHQVIVSEVAQQLFTPAVSAAAFPSSGRSPPAL